MTPDPRLLALLAAPDLARVLAALAAGGARAWVVGGAVRDAEREPSPSSSPRPPPRRKRPPTPLADGTSEGGRHRQVSTPFARPRASGL